MKDIQQADQVLRIVGRKGLSRYASTFDEEVGVLFDFTVYFGNFGLFFTDSFLHVFVGVYIVDNDDSRGFRRNGIGSDAAGNGSQDIRYASLGNTAESQAQGFDSIALAVIDCFA